jgi:hypothetical protein
VVDSCGPLASLSFGKFIDQPTDMFLTFLPLWKELSKKTQGNETLEAIFT